MSVAFPSVDDSRDRPGCSKLSEASTAGGSAAEEAEPGAEAGPWTPLGVLLSLRDDERDL